MQGWLTGWKDFANHFGVSVKVVKRWYKIYSMPIMRTPEGRPTLPVDLADEWLVEFYKKQG